MIYAEQPSLTNLPNADRTQKVCEPTEGKPAMNGAVETFSKWPALPWWKRALDLTLIAVALPLCAPAMLLMACLIKIVSPGPIFFTQDRVGRQGKNFRLYKFRTMRADSAAAPH